MVATAFGPRSRAIERRLHNAEAIFFGSTVFNTTDATDSGGFDRQLQCPDTYLGTVSQDVWFRLTAIDSGTAIVSTCSSVDFDTDLIAYEDGCGNLQQIACNGDFAGCTGYSSRMSFNVTIGSGGYLVRLGGWNSSESGSGTINVSYSRLGGQRCCFGWECEDGYSANDCIASGGDYQGDNTTCGTVRSADRHPSVPAASGSATAMKPIRTTVGMVVGSSTRTSRAARYVRPSTVPAARGRRVLPGGEERMLEERWRVLQRGVV